MLDTISALFAPGAPLGLLALYPPGWGGNLLLGLWHSMQIAVGAYALGLGIGICGAYGKLYGNEVVRDIFALYTTIVRAVPELILILILYYAGTDMINKVLMGAGFDRWAPSRLLIGTVVLGVVMGAYMTEVLRGAILAVPQGQIEAARAYGMSPLLLARRITFPQMMMNAIGGMANLWLNATKDTALLAVIGLNELTLTTKQAAGTTKAFMLFFIAAMVIYMIVSVVSGRVFAAIERWARKGQPKLGGGGI